MKKEQSFGIIPLQRNAQRWQVFIVQQKQGHFGFPKGHPEANETPFETACRELHEETGLVQDKQLKIKPLKETYLIPHPEEVIEKTVVYFPCLVQGQVLLQKEEILDGLWLSLEKAHKTLSFPNTKQMLLNLSEQLKSL